MDAAYSDFCCSNERSDYDKFTEYHRNFKKFFKRDHDINVKSIGNGFQSDPSSFWKYVNSKRKSDVIPCTMKHGRRILSSGHAIFSAFADHFGSVYCGENFVLDENISFPEMKSSNLSSLNYSTDTILQALKRLKPKKIPGSDNPPPRLF